MNHKTLTALLSVGYFILLSGWPFSAAEETAEFVGNLDDAVERTNTTTPDHEQVEFATASSSMNEATPEDSLTDRTDMKGTETLKKDLSKVSGEEVTSETEGGKKDETGKEQKKTVVTHIPELPPSIIDAGQFQNGSWFIMFYASWCEHSQLALPEFMQVLQYVVDNNITGVFLGKIDVTKHGEVAKHFKIMSTPTFIFYQNGMRLDYDDVAKLENMKNFMLHIITAEVPQINTTKQLAELQKNHSIFFLIVYDEEIDQDWKSVYMRMTREKVLKATFAYTTDPSIVEEYPVTTLPCIMVFKEGQTHFFRDALASYALSKWVELERSPDFPTVNMTSIRLYVAPTTSRRLGILVVHEDPSRRRIAQKKAIEAVKKLAQSRHMHRKCQFLLLEGVEVAEKILRRPVTSLPVFLVYEPFTGFHYLFESDDKNRINEQAIARFLDKISSKKIEPQGGSTLTDRIAYFGQLIYATAKTMTTHRPILSMATIFCVTGAICFYVTIFCQGRTKSSVSKNKQKAAARKAAMARKRKEKEAAIQKDTTAESARRRCNKKKDNSKDDEDESVRHNSDEETEESGSATASDEELGSQAEELSDEETPHEQNKKED